VRLFDSPGLQKRGLPLNNSRPAAAETIPCPDLTTIFSPQAAKAVCTYSEDVGYRRNIPKHKTLPSATLLEMLLGPMNHVFKKPLLPRGRMAGGYSEQLHACMGAGMISGAVAEHTAEILLRY